MIGKKNEGAGMAGHGDFRLADVLRRAYLSAAKRTSRLKSREARTPCALDF